MLKSDYAVLEDAYLRGNTDLEALRKAVNGIVPRTSTIKFLQMKDVQRRRLEEQLDHAYQVACSKRYRHPSHTSS